MAFPPYSLPRFDMLALSHGSGGEYWTCYIPCYCCHLILQRPLVYKVIYQPYAEIVLRYHVYTLIGDERVVQSLCPVDLPDLIMN
jgi:hypothetical protein